MAATEHASERDVAEERLLLRRRVRHAFVRGSSRGSLLDEPNRNGPLVAGVGVAVLACLIAGVVGILRDDGPPDGWDNEGTVLAVADSSTRYVVDDGRRRAVVNDTSLLLSVGASPRVVTVDRDDAESLPEGPPLGEQAWPFEPPALAPSDIPLVLCVQQGSSPRLFVGDPPVGDPVSLLARFDGGVWLVTGTVRHPFTSPEALDALGYREAPVVDVPAAWLELLPVGASIERLPVPPPAFPPPGAPPFLVDGQLLSDAGSGQLFLVDGAALRPIVNRTALQLLFGETPPPPTAVDPAVIPTLPAGEPIGDPSLPATPPAPVAAGEGWACARSSGEAYVSASIPEPEPAGQAGTDPNLATLVLPPDQGLLVSGPPVEEFGAPELLLLAGGRAFPFATPDVAVALGYDPEAARPLSGGVVALLPRAPELRRIELST